MGACRPASARRAMCAFLPLVDPEAERGAEREGMVMYLTSARASPH